MKILGYMGTSITSSLIKIQTRSKYSHIGVMLHDGSVVEAWQGTGVRQIENAFIGHADNTLIDVFSIKSINTDFDEPAATKYLLEQIGKKYDYRSVWRFLSRRDAPDNESLFCSEMAELTLIAGGLRLLNGSPSEHSPRDTLLSPILNFDTTIWKDN